jgi:hypothetical protein
MLDRRRSFVKNLAGATWAFLFFQDQPPMPTRRVRIPPNPPEPAEKPDSAKPDSTTVRVDLRAQEKELRETLDQLFAKVSDLKMQLDQLQTASVFSVPVFKQTQEIEKLAKRLKGYAKV